MDHERYLISKILQEKDLSPVLEAGIQPKFFNEPNNRRVFERLMALNSEYASVPTLRMLKKDFPSYRFVAVDEPYDYLIGETRKYYALGLLEEALTQAVGQYQDEELDTLKMTLRDVLEQIDVELPTSRDTNLAESGEDRLDRYEELEENRGELRGIPMGFPTIDRATQGWQPKQLVTFVGPPKAGKTTIMLLAAIAAWRAGHRPLVISFEMSNEELEERIDAFMAGISHTNLRSGNMSDEEWKALTRSIHEMTHRDFILSNDMHSVTTVSGVIAKAKEYDPALLIVDGVYMMQDETQDKEGPGTPRALTNITRGFKRGAQHLEIPIIITTQILEWKMDKKKGVTSNSIGYSSSFSQDSDVIIGVERTDDPEVIKIKIVLGRNVPMGVEKYVTWDWATGRFEEMEDYDPEAASGDDQIGGF